MMYIRKRIRKRSFVRKHWLVLSALALVVCLGAFFAAGQLDLMDEPDIPIAQNPSTFRPSPPVLKSNERLVYPYSVIPGGVRSREELAREIATDPVVATHYAKFNVNQSRMVNATEDQFMHVAYRIQDKVYWTARKIKIPQGETLITDGTDTARTRCGNRVSATPLEPVHEPEPATESFEVPQIAELMSDTGLDLNNVPEMTPYIPGQSLNPPGIPRTPPAKAVTSRKLTHFRPLFAMRPENTVVPEPATWSLLAIGLAGLGAIRFMRKK